MFSHNEILSAIEPPDNKEVLIKKYQSVKDITNDLIYCFQNYSHQAKPVAQLYGTGNIYKDTRNIYNYLVDNIKYDAEKDRDQTSRSFSRIIHDGWGDCKHTASIVAAIAYNMGYNVIFRVVKYINDGQPLYHIYTIVENKNGTQIIVDPLQQYNYEKPYNKLVGNYKAINKQNMALTRLSGTGTMMPMGNTDVTEVEIIDRLSGKEIILTPNVTDEMLGEIEELSGIGRRTKQERKQQREEKKEQRQEKKQEKKKNKVEAKQVKKQKREEKKEQRGGTVVKKVALAPIRGAFSALLLVNFKNFATRFQKAIKTNPDKVQAFAKKFGYNWNIFKSQVEKGANKRPLMAIKGINDVIEVDGMGVVVTAAALATASAAVAAAVTLLKQLGIGEEGDEKVLNDAANDLSRKLNTGSSSQPSGAQNFNASDSGANNVDDSGGSNDDDKPDQSFFKKYKTPILVVTAMGVIYLGGKAFKVF